MKIKIFAILIFLLFGSTYNVFASEYVDGEVFVKFNKNIPADIIQDTIDAYSMKTSNIIKGLGVYKLKLSDEYTVEEIVEILSDDPDVIYAEPNYIRYASIIPDDLHWNQWGLQNTGQNLTCDDPPDPDGCFGQPTGTAGSDIDAIVGWDTQTGTESIIIAVIDTGVDLDHPDLDGKIFNGYDFVNDDYFADDDNGHGTHVAGIAAAETNNGIGVAGVCWGCRIMPLKVLNASGAGSDGAVIAAIDFAIENKANVLNLSLGGGAFSNTLEAALKKAYDNNIVSVCASGNDNYIVSYPAAYDKYCIAVGATDNRDERASFSNFGDELDVAAPGVDIYSTSVVGGSNSCGEESATPGYGFCSGTSMAAPFVAGLAGIILSENPTYNVDEVAFRLIQTAEDVNSSSNVGFDELLGAGRIKIKGATTPGETAKIETTAVSIDEKSSACFISAIYDN